MTTILEEPEVSVDQSPEKKTKKLFYQVFLGFRQPLGLISFGGTCNVNEYLGRIFNKDPQEICGSIFWLMFQGGDGFMQEYLSLNDASYAVAQASLFANISMCRCFLIQEAYFYIKEFERQD